VKSAVIALLAALVGAGLAGNASAHGRSVSYSTWSQTADGAEVRARISRLELTRLGLDPATSAEARAAVGALLVRELRMSAGGTPCEADGVVTPLPAEQGWVVYGWRVTCAATGDRRIESRLLLEVAPSHMHFARVVDADGSSLRVLSEVEPIWTLEAATEAAAPEAVGSSFRDYIVLGIEHILSGWDHLAFVLALLLLAATLGEVTALVTSFTLAHSVTLGLAVLGVVRPEAHAVEALIAFSIALVAAENAWILAGRGRVVPAVATLSLVVLGLVGAGFVPRGAYLGLALFVGCHFALLSRSDHPARLRAAVAFAFGLIHGFGFAGVLAEMSLPTARLVPALLGFNLGVEVGQLAVVAVAWPVLRWIATRFEQNVFGWLAEVGSAAICGLGLFWFVTRGFA
jgi:hypothetical protein